MKRYVWRTGLTIPHSSASGTETGEGASRLLHSRELEVETSWCRDTLIPLWTEMVSSLWLTACTVWCFCLSCGIIVSSLGGCPFSCPCAELTSQRMWASLLCVNDVKGTAETYYNKMSWNISHILHKENLKLISFSLKPRHILGGVPRPLSLPGIWDSVHSQLNIAGLTNTSSTL